MVKIIKVQNEEFNVNMEKPSVLGLNYNVCKLIPYASFGCSLFRVATVNCPSPSHSVLCPHSIYPVLHHCIHRSPFCLYQGSCIFILLLPIYSVSFFCMSKSYQSETKSSYQQKNERKCCKFNRKKCNKTKSLDLESRNSRSTIVLLFNQVFP